MSADVVAKGHSHLLKARHEPILKPTLEPAKRYDHQYLMPLCSGGIEGADGTDLEKPHGKTESRGIGIPLHPRGGSLGASGIGFHRIRETW
jgi:hypothetical protein